jgi:gliding motility-associated-like protein
LKNRYLLPLLCGFFFTQTHGQSAYNLVGTSRAVPNSDCYELTAAREWQNGAVWYTERLKLSQSFDLEFLMNFGGQENGADGIVFVLQTASNTALGKAGGGIGFEGFAPSFGIEFDTHQNRDFNDPAEDHVAFVRDGNSKHGPRAYVTQASASSDLEDGRDHRVRVTWEPSQKKISVLVDCVPRLSQEIDLVGDVFRGQTEVFWGFTAATGGSYARQMVCLRRDIVKTDTLHLCQGDVARLVARPSSDGQYFWTPSIGLSAINVANPTVRLQRSQDYEVSYRDQCDRFTRDKIRVEVETPPTLELGADREACEGEVLELKPSLTGAVTPATYRWSTGDTAATLRPRTSGTYALTAQTKACRVRDSLTFTRHPLPELAKIAERLCVHDQPVTLEATATGPGLTYRWSPGNGTAPTLLASAGGDYQVAVRNVFGCEITRKFVLNPDCPPYLFVPDAFSPNGDGLNDILTFESPEPMDVEISVFDRWGEPIFRSSSAQTTWDGTYRGSPSPAGVYPYRVRYRPRRRIEGPWFDRQGSLLLVR